MPPLFDANAFVGPWPFSTNPVMEIGELERRLRRGGVTGAAISPLEAVFAPEPMPANRRLFALVERRRSLRPVPIVNPALADWREQVGICAGEARVRAVRILPNYHGYRLSARKLAPFVAAVTEARLRLVVNVRLVDERQEYFALNLRRVPLAELAAFAEALPAGAAVLYTGLYREELRRLAARTSRFLADVSFAEGLRTVETLRGFLPAERIVFGSAFPLLSIDAQAAKIRTAKIGAAERATMAAGNARRFFGP